MASILTSEDVVRSLISRRGSDKHAALQAIDVALPPVDLGRLCVLLCRELTNRFAAPRHNQWKDIYTCDARCWLLSALGRAAGDDAKASAFIQKHLDSAAARYYWACYWALEAVVAG